MATGTSNIHGFENGKWYKFRSVGDNNVIQLDSPEGSKLICEPENSDLNEIQLFQVTILPTGKYCVSAKCQKSKDTCQVWDYLSHRELLILKKKSPAEKSTQSWVSELVHGYNSLYLIQSNPGRGTDKCLKNMGQGKQIKLTDKTADCLSDRFTRWYLEPQTIVETSNLPTPAPTPTLPLPESVPATQVATPEAIPTASALVLLPVTTAQPEFEGFKDGVWYKFRSVGDNNVIQVLESAEGHKLISMPESIDLIDLQRFRVTLLPSGKFSIGTGAKSLPISHVWDFQLQGEVLTLNLTMQQEIEKFSQNWAPSNIPNHKPECLIQPNPSPEAPESDAHKCIKNMGAGKPIQLVNQSPECDEDSFVRWILEPEDNSIALSSPSSTTPSMTSFPDVVMALQAKEKEGSKLNAVSTVEPMDTA